MQFRVISSNEVRVLLSLDEMNELEISFEGMDYSDTSTRRFMWELFDIVKKETGFDAAKQQTTVKVYPKRNGGCELYLLRGERARDCPFFLFESFDDFLLCREDRRLRDIVLDGEIVPTKDEKLYLKLNSLPDERALELLGEYSVAYEGEYLFSYLKNRYLFGY